MEILLNLSKSRKGLKKKTWEKAKDTYVCITIPGATCAHLSARGARQSVHGHGQSIWNGTWYNIRKIYMNYVTASGFFRRWPWERD